MVLERFDSAPGNELLILKTDIMEKKKQVAIDSLKLNVDIEYFPEGTTMDEAVEMILNNKDAIKAWIDDYEFDIELSKDDDYMKELCDEYRTTVEYLNYRLTELK